MLLLEFRIALKMSKLITRYKIEISTSVTWPNAVFSKKLNLRKKADRNFRGTFLKNRFRHQNFIQIPRADWPGVVVISTPFERQKIEVHIFERANLSGFGTWKFTAKEDLNRRKQVFLLNFRPWPAQKPKIWSIFYGK